MLRHEDSGICQTGGSGMGSVSTGSQVSVLHPHASGTLSQHWFTATPNPNNSLFKPFVFVPGVTGSELTACQSRDSSLTHALYSAHSKMKPCIESDITAQIRRVLRGIELKYLSRVEEFASKPAGMVSSDAVGVAVEMNTVFHESATAEMDIYANFNF